MDISEIMKLTCWESLSYCCDLKKPCKLRDEAMRQLKLTNDEYELLKKQFDASLIKLLKKK